MVKKKRFGSPKEYFWNEISPTKQKWNKRKAIRGVRRLFKKILKITEKEDE